LSKTRLGVNIKIILKCTQRLYASIKVGIFDKSNYIALTLVLLNKSFNVLPNDIFGEDDYTVDIR